MTDRPQTTAAELVEAGRQAPIDRLADLLTEAAADADRIEDLGADRPQAAALVRCANIYGPGSIDHRRGAYLTAHDITTGRRLTTTGDCRTCGAGHYRPHADTCAEAAAHTAGDDYAVRLTAAIGLLTMRLTDRLAALHYTGQAAVIEALADRLPDIITTEALAGRLPTAALAALAWPGNITTGQDRIDPQPQEAAEAE